MRVLVTGGAGYIGSHAVLRLCKDGHEVVALDNLHRGHARAIGRIREAVGEAVGDAVGDASARRVRLAVCDLRDCAAVREVLEAHAIDSVLHFAALAYVGESASDPLGYYDNNVGGLVSLLRAMQDAQARGAPVRRFVFSSTCAVYGDGGDGAPRPLAEDAPLAPVSPYGRGKLIGEQILRDEHARRASTPTPLAIACLRYFNVCGCDRGGMLGEDHRPETHLIPVLLQRVRDGHEDATVFGDDYPTPDGTCVRDYIHVDDLVDAHLAVLSRLGDAACRTYNLGTGRGASVREVIDAVRRVTRRPIRAVVAPRRAGDAASAVADPSAIARAIGWRASVTSIDDMVADAWRWMQDNPGGYGDAGGGA
jgi:UDP-glucose 4-epimerase